jgi:hypothetical protein
VNLPGVADERLGHRERGLDEPAAERIHLGRRRAERRLEIGARLFARLAARFDVLAH